MQRPGQQRTRERTQGGATARFLLALGALVLPATGWAPATSPASPAPAATAAPRGDAYAVIVHPLVPTSGVTLPQLRALFLGTRHTWDDGARVVLIVQAPGTRTRAMMLRALYQMDEGAFKRYWIARTFRGADGAGDGEDAGPTLVASDAMARRLTASIPGAVAIVPAAEVDRGVRVLRVDGRLPGADGYPLTAGEP